MSHTSRQSSSIKQQYFSSSELARHFGLRPNQFAQWRAARRGPRWVKLNGTVRYYWPDVVKWIRQTHGAKFAVATPIRRSATC